MWFDEVILPDRSTGVLHTFLATKKKRKKREDSKKSAEYRVLDCSRSSSCQVVPQDPRKLKDRLYGAKVDVINVK